MNKICVCLAPILLLSFSGCGLHTLLTDRLSAADEATSTTTTTTTYPSGGGASDSGQSASQPAPADTRKGVTEAFLMEVAHATLKAGSANAKLVTAADLPTGKFRLVRFQEDIRIDSDKGPDLTAYYVHVPAAPGQIQEGDALSAKQTDHNGIGFTASFDIFMPTELRIKDAALEQWGVRYSFDYYRQPPSARTGASWTRYNGDEGGYSVASVFQNTPEHAADHSPYYLGYLRELDEYGNFGGVLVLDGRKLTGQVLMRMDGRVRLLTFTWQK